MLLSARTSIRHAHLPVELLAVTCTKPSIHRYLSNDASRRAPPSTARGHSRGKVNANATSFRRSAKVPLASTVKTTEVATNKPKRLLEPHVLSQRIKALCDELQLDAAVDMLKNAPKDAQSTPVWNTLIWEALKAERWNLAYKLYTELKRRGLTPTTRTYQTMFSGLSRLGYWQSHPVQLTHAHQLYDYFIKHLQTVKHHMPKSEDLTVSPLAKYIKILGDAGDFQKIFDVYYAMEPEGPLAANRDIFTAMFQAMGSRSMQAAGDVPAVHPTQVQTSSSPKLLWTQMERISKKSPGFEIDSHLIAAALKALSRGGASDQELAFEIIRSHIGLSRPGEPPVKEAKDTLTVHTLAAALEICNELKKPKLCIHYLHQAMRRGASASSSRGGIPQGHVLDRGHMEKGLVAHLDLADSGVRGHSVQALDMLQWMLRTEVTHRHVQLRPLAATYHIVLAVCRSEGDWAGATRTFEMMTGYTAGDFADLDFGNAERKKPVMETRSKGRNLSPDAETMSSIVRTALSTHVPGSIRQSLRMVDHFGLDHLLTPIASRHTSPTKKDVRLAAFYQGKLAMAVVEAVELLKKVGTARHEAKDDPIVSQLQMLARAKVFLASGGHKKEKALQGSTSKPRGNSNQYDSRKAAFMKGQSSPYRTGTPMRDNIDDGFILDELPIRRTSARS